MQTWEKVFGHRFFHQYKTEDFPMLIAVRRAAIEEKTRFSPPDYRHELLMEGNRLAKIDEVATKASVLRELKTFKESFDHNETNLVSEEEDQRPKGKIDTVLPFGTFISLVQRQITGRSRFSAHLAIYIVSDRR